MNIHVRARFQSVHHQHAHMISDGPASIYPFFWLKSKQICFKHFR